MIPCLIIAPSARARVLLSVCALLLLTSVSCRPDLEGESSVRHGYLNEFCEIDDHCQAEFACEDNACQRLDTPGSISCEQICDYLVTECGRSERDCEGSCRETIEGWSDEAADVFGTCSLGLTSPELTCDLARSDDAASFCYQQIPLRQERRERCDLYVDQARSYASGASEEQLTNLRQKCYILARTRSAADWSITEDCDEDLRALTEDEVIACYKETFGVSLDD